MIGNDVVDLRDPETFSGAQHPGFDARVFGPAERLQIACAREPRRERWRLWAAKEAAYKALRRSEPGTVFSPRSLVVELAEDGRGGVRIGARRLALRVRVDGERVSAIATLHADAGAALSVHELSRGGTRASLRSALGAAIEDTARQRGYRGPTEILRRDRVPSFRVGAHCFPMSISHHGRFASAVVLWDDDGG